MKPIEGLEVERTGRLLVLAWASAQFGVVDAVAKLGRSLQERPEVQAGPIQQQSPTNAAFAFEILNLQLLNEATLFSRFWDVRSAD